MTATILQFPIRAPGNHERQVRATYWVMADRLDALSRSAEDMDAADLQAQLDEIDRELEFLLAARHGPTLEAEATLRQWLLEYWADLARARRRG